MWPPQRGCPVEEETHDIPRWSGLETPCCSSATRNRTVEIILWLLFLLITLKRLQVSITSGTELQRRKAEGVLGYVDWNYSVPNPTGDSEPYIHTYIHTYMRACVPTYTHTYIDTAGRGSSIGSVSAWHASGSEFDPHIRHILSWRLGYEKISTAILPLPLIQEEHLSAKVCALNTGKLPRRLASEPGTLWLG